MAFGAISSWNSMCNIKNKVDKYIFWNIGKGDTDVWYDNWSDFGPLWNYLPPKSKLRKQKLKDAILDNHRNWDCRDIYLPDYVRIKINSKPIVIRESIPDTTIWMMNNREIFTIASARQLLKKKTGLIL